MSQIINQLVLYVLIWHLTKSLYIFYDEIKWVCIKLNNTNFWYFLCIISCKQTDFSPDFQVELIFLKIARMSWYFSRLVGKADISPDCQDELIFHKIGG